MSTLKVRKSPGRFFRRHINYVKFPQKTVFTPRLFGISLFLLCCGFFMLMFCSNFYEYKNKQFLFGSWIGHDHPCGDLLILLYQDGSGKIYFRQFSESFFWSEAQGKIKLRFEKSFPLQVNDVTYDGTITIYTNFGHYKMHKEMPRTFRQEGFLIDFYLALC